MHESISPSHYLVKRKFKKVAKLIFTGFLIGMVSFIIFKNYRYSPLVGLASNVDQPIGQLKLVYSANIPGAVTLLSDSETQKSNNLAQSSLSELSSNLNFGTSHRLILPNESEITYAGLIWGGDYSPEANNPVTSMLPVRLTTPRGSYDISPDPEISSIRITDLGQYYSRYAEITEYIQNGNAGDYQVNELPQLSFENTDKDILRGWTMIVAYKNPSLRMRHVSIHTGNDFVNTGQQKTLLKLNQLDLETTDPTSSLLFGEFGLPSHTTSKELMVECSKGATKLEINHDLNRDLNYTNSENNWNTTAFNLSGSLKDCKDDLEIKMNIQDPKLVNYVASLTDTPSPNLKSFLSFEKEKIADQYYILNKYSLVNLSQKEIRNIKLHEFYTPGSQFITESLLINGETPKLRPSSNELPLGTLMPGEEIEVEFKLLVNPINTNKSISPQVSFAFDQDGTYTTLKQNLAEQSFKDILP